MKNLAGYAVQKLGAHPHPDRIKALRALCAETGDDGKPIHSSRAREFSEIWIGPYLSYWPDWIYLLLKNSSIEGYLTGCPYSSANKVLRRAHVITSLLPKLIRRELHFSPDMKRHLKRLAHLEQSPESQFSRKTRLLIENEYPAHLHINLANSARGSGLGAKLLAAFEADLKKAQQHGIHVFCGKGPLSFYEKNGFSVLETIRFKNKFDVFCLGKKL